MDLLALIFAGILAVLAGIGIAIGLVACAVFLGLIGICVVSVSAIVGFSRGKVLSGLRALFVQLGVLVGAPLGAIAALVLDKAWPEIAHHGVILTMGGATGAFGGLLVALLAHRAVQMAVERFPRLRLSRTTLIPSS